MPPKLRRPAAAVAVAKAGLRRGRGLRRPAAGGEAGDAGDEAGEIDCSQISLEECQNLKEVEVVSGSYWEAPLKAALRVSEVKLKDGQKMIGAQVLGTQCEGLLKWASGQPDRVVRGHLCPKDCPGTPHEDGLLHIRKLRRLEAAREEWNDKHAARGASRPRRGRAGRVARRQEEASPGHSGGGGPRLRENLREPSSKTKEDGEEEEPQPARKEQQVQTRGQEGHCGGIGSHRGRPKPQDEEKVPQEGSSDCSQEEQRFQRGVDRVLLREHKQPLRRSSAVWLNEPGAHHRSQTTGCAPDGGFGRGQRCVGHPRGGHLRCPGGDSSPFVLPLPQAELGHQDVPGHAPGSADSGSHAGSWPPRPGGGVPRCGGAAPQGARNDDERRALYSGSTNRVAAQGGDQHELSAGVYGSRSPGPGRSTAGRDWRPADPTGPEARQGARAKMGERRWKERSTKRQRRQERPEEGRRRQSRSEEGKRGLRWTPGRQCDEMRSSQKIQETLLEGSGVERMNDERESVRTAPVLAVPGVSLTSPRKGLHDGIQGWGADSEPLHDWQRLEPGVPPPCFAATGTAPERVDGAHVELGMPAASAASRPVDPTMKGVDDVFHRTGVCDMVPTNWAGCHFSDLGEPLFQSLQQHLWKRTSKAMTTAKEFLFPLPLGDYDEVHPSKRPWLRVILLALNSFYGAGLSSTLQPTELQKQVVQTVLVFLDRMWCWAERVPSTSFDDLFRVKGVDYRGEEVKLARSFNWKSISAAFPPEVATLDIADFCTGGCRMYLSEFEKFMLPEDQQRLGRVPRTMVSGEDWPEVCRGLLQTGICGILPQRELYHVGGKPLLNGLFSVSKNEFQGTIELNRLIMNMVPLNGLCVPFAGDVGTLPTISGLNSFYLEDGEVAVMGSEDIKCFYYLFRIPAGWQRFMGFAREVPSWLCPPGWGGEPCHLVSRVLPMGFLNSVGLAQHIHRNVVKWSRREGGGPGGLERELRRDRPAPVSKELFRVYLDNWDEIRKMDASLAREIEGVPSQQQQALREKYLELELPRHPKKSVESSLKAEIQGALLDGEAGVAYAKPDKIMKYLGLAWELVSRGRATQREVQVVAGGLVYISLFRRQLLGSLNAIWRHIEDMKKDPPVVRKLLPREVKAEVLRFIALIPLAQMDFRLRMEPQVTASDASSTGGGICASVGLTSYGHLAQSALLRGKEEEPFSTVEVLTVGLFDGISALRVAAELLHLPVAGHVSVECHAGAQRVVEAAFPGSLHYGQVQDIDREVVQEWARSYPSVGVVLLGAGPPCQDVSGLNVDRAGSQKGARSSLYKEVPRIRGLVQQYFPWAQVHLLCESVASMDGADRGAMSHDLELQPLRVDAVGVSLCRRPRLYWLTWDIESEEGISPQTPVGTGWEVYSPVELHATINAKDYLEPGWFLPPGVRLPTFTTARPSAKPGRRPAGLHTCDEATLERWGRDSHRYPPYQYKPENCLHHAQKEVRVASIIEREVILGFPAHYTEQCLPKQQRQGTAWEDMRKTLLGNTWSVPVVLLLMKQLFERLGVVPPCSVQELVDRCAPGKGRRLQTVLQRPPLRRETTTTHPDVGLARRLGTLVSIKGEDLLLQGASEPVVKSQRLRQTVPGKLWKWKEVTGWQWKSGGDHINLLELRATLTTIKWILQKRKTWNCRVIHLVDSLVVLHSLSRGRSSSVRLRRTLMRINSLLLASNLHPVWTYILTSQNPADRPSRRIKCRKWGKVKRG